MSGRIFALKKKAKGSGHVWKEFKAEFNSNETEDDVMIEWNNNGRKRMFPRTTDTTTKVTISLMFDYTNNTNDNDNDHSNTNESGSDY